MRRTLLIKRIISALLTTLMVISALPARVISFAVDSVDKLAENGEQQVDSIDEGPNISINNGAGVIFSEAWDGSSSEEFAGGDGSSEHPYLIASAAQLKYFADAVNSGEGFEGGHICLTRNLDLGGYKWTPIGKNIDHPFQGTFVGGLHEIKDFAVTEETQSDVTCYGLFGNAQDAVIQDLGVTDAVINVHYCKDMTRVGGLVGLLSGGRIVNCYSDYTKDIDNYEGINATFESIDPLEHGAIVYTYVPSVLTSDNENGQGVIIDLTESASAIDKSISIEGYVTAVRFIGTPGVKYTGLGIQIGTVPGNSAFDMLIEFEDFFFSGNEDSGALFADNDRRVFIRNKGESAISASNEAPAINLENNDLYFIGAGSITVSGKDGKAAGNTTENQSGGNAYQYCGIVAKSVCIMSSGTVVINGGNGSDGSNGGDGSNGAKGIKDGGNGTNSGTSANSGGNGKDGGDGSCAIFADALHILAGSVVVKGGDGGNGGNGGNGGRGGDGNEQAGNGGDGGNGGNGGNGGDGSAPMLCPAISCEGSLSLIEGKPGNGGDGGDGGRGGNGANTNVLGWTAGNGGRGGNAGYGGNSGSWTDCTLESDKNIALQHAQKGNGGAAGGSGSGGEKGYKKGWANKNGVDGKSGNFASQGTDTGSTSSVSYSVDDCTLEASDFIPNCNRARLIIGGFAGEICNGAEIDNCAAAVNVMNANVKYDYNAVNGQYAGTPDYYIGIAGGAVSRAVSSGAVIIEKDDGVIEKTYTLRNLSENNAQYSDDKIKALTVLTNGSARYIYDDAGVQYDTGLNGSFDVPVLTRTVIAFFGDDENADITIPTFVYDGGFVAEVSAVAGRFMLTNSGESTEHFPAFYQSNVHTITLPESVKRIGSRAFELSTIHEVDLGGAEEIGEGLLMGCAEIECVRIGSALKAIPEIKNGTTPFGIKKDGSFKRYRVDGNNESYASDDNGVLYEVFDLKDEDGIHLKFLKVGIIDVPAYAGGKNWDYAPEVVDEDCHIVRIYPNAFAYQKRVKSVDLSHIRVVGAGAFRSSSVESVKFGQVSSETIDVSVLGTEYAFPEGEYYETAVCKNAFSGCQNLKKVDLSSDALTMIGTDAFANCGKESDPLIITLGRNIIGLGLNESAMNAIGNGTVDETELNNMDFISCFRGTPVKSFNVCEGNTRFIAQDGVLYYLPSNESVARFVGFPSHDSQKRESFAVPAEINGLPVTAVSGGSFAGSKYLKYLKVTNYVQSIGSNAFNNAESLRQITFGADLKKLENGAEMLNCPSLYAIEVETGNDRFWSVDGVLFGYSNYTDAGDKIELYKYPAAKPGDEYKIPNVVGDKPVVHIGAGAFMNNTSLRRLIISSPIEYFAPTALQNCGELSFVYFKAGNFPGNLKHPTDMANAFSNNHYGGRMVCFADSENIGWNNVSGIYDGSGNKLTEERDDNGQIRIVNANGEQTIPQFKIALFSDEYYQASAGNMLSDGTGVYAFVVRNKQGEDLTDIDVSLYIERDINEEKQFQLSQSIRTVNGVALFYNLIEDQHYVLRAIDKRSEFAEEMGITAYFPFEDADFVPDMTMRRTYITLSSIPTVQGTNVTCIVQASDKIKALSGDVEEVYGDGTVTQSISSEMAEVNLWLTDDVSVGLYCALEEESTIVSYSLMLDDTVLCCVDDPQEIAELNMCASTDGNGKKFVSWNVSLPVELIDATQKTRRVRVVVRTEDGESRPTITSVPLRILFFDKAFTLPVLPSLQFMESSKVAEIIKTLFGENSKETPIAKESTDAKWSMKISVSMSSLKMQVVFNASKDMLSLKGNKEDPRAWEIWKDRVKYYVDRGFQESLFEKPPTNNYVKFGLGFTFAGFAELKIKADHSVIDPDFVFDYGIYGKVNIYIKAGATLKIVAFPLRLELDLDASAKVELKYDLDRESSKVLAGNVNLTLEGSLELRIGCGFACLSVGAYGNIKIKLVVGIVPTDGIRSAEATGEIGLYAKLKLGPISFKRSVMLWKYMDCVLWPQETSNPALDAQNYEIRPSAKYRAANTGEEAAESFAGNTPTLWMHNGKIYLFMQEDVYGRENLKGDYDQYNYNKIVYSVYDSETGSFGETTVLDDNGLVDGGFEICNDGNTMRLVYLQSNCRLNEELVEQLEGEDGYLSHLELKTACFDEESEEFIPENVLTNDEFADTAPVFCKIDSKLSLIWIKNKANTIIGETVTREIDGANVVFGSEVWAITYSENGWETPRMLFAAPGMIIGFAAGDDRILYLTDSNNDPETMIVDGETVKGIADRILHDYRIGSGEETVSEEKAYSLVSFIDGRAAVLLDGMLYAIDGNIPLLASPAEDLANDFTVLPVADHQTSAILFVKNEGEQSDLYGIFSDGEGRFGDAIKLTEMQKNEHISSYGALDDGMGLRIAAIITRNSTAQGRTVDSAESYSFFDEQQEQISPVSVDSMSYFKCEYPQGVEIGEAIYDKDQIKEGGTLTIAVPVTNCGYLPIELSDLVDDILVSVDGKARASTSNGFFDAEGGDTGASILSGTTKYITITFKLGVPTACPIKLTICGNEQDLNVWYCDLAVYGKVVSIKNKETIVVCVANKGTLPSTVTVNVDSGEKRIHGDTVTRNNGEPLVLNAGEDCCVEIPLGMTNINTDDRVVRVSVISSADDALQANNAVLITAINTPGDINQDMHTNITDVTILLNYLASENNKGGGLFDVNCDDTVNITDVTDLLNILAGQ